MRSVLFKVGQARKMGNYSHLRPVITMCSLQLTEIFIFSKTSSKLKISVLVLIARSNRLADLKPLTDEVLTELSIVRPGEISFVPKQAR
jgi:hypothetical protein